MARTAGLILGSNALTSLFSSTIQIFKCIRDSGEFNRKHQTYITELNRVYLQFARWGEAAKNYPTTAGEEEEEQAKALIEGIRESFEHAEKASKSCQRLGRPNEFTATHDHDLKSARDVEIGEGIKILIARYEKEVPTTEAEWVMYKERDFKALIDSVRENVHELVTLFPMIAPLQKRLAAEEAVQIKNNRTLQTLVEISGGEHGDAIMEAAAKWEYEGRFGMTFEKLRGDTQGNLMIGPDFGPEAATIALQNGGGTKMRFFDINARSGGDTHIGPSYAGRFGTRR